MKIVHSETIILTPKEMELLNSVYRLIDAIYHATETDELEKISGDAVDAITDLLEVCEKED